MNDSSAPDVSSLELTKGGYSDDEVAQIYELGRFFIENGDLRRAEVIMHGLTQVAPEYVPGWLAVCCVQYQSGNLDAALSSAQQAHRLAPQMPEALLFLIVCLLSAQDLNAAGTHLGTVGEMIDAGSVQNPLIIRFYRGQIARFQSR